MAKEAAKPHETFEHEGHVYELFLVKDLPGAKPSIFNHKYPWETKTTVRKAFRFKSTGRQNWYEDAMCITRDNIPVAHTSHSYEGHLSTAHWSFSAYCWFDALSRWREFVIAHGKDLSSKYVEPLPR